MARKPRVAVAEDGVASDAVEEGRSSKEGKRARTLRQIISQAGQWRQPRWVDEDELAERCSTYKSLIALKDPPEIPTAESFSMFIGVSYRTLKKYKTGESCSERVQELVYDVLTWMEGIWVQASAQDIISVANYIWYSKQWFDMKEPDSKVTLNLPSPLKELPSTDSVLAKYGDLPEVKKLPKDDKTKD